MPKPLKSQLVLLLWIPMAVHLSWLGHRAYTELTDAYVIEGLFRTYLPPRAVHHGWLIDARTGSLADELKLRYGRGPVVEGSDVASWTAVLVNGGYQVRSVEGPGTTPRLLMLPDAVWLQTGMFQGQPTVFDPKRGVILLEEGSLSARVPALELVGVAEHPW